MSFILSIFLVLVGTIIISVIIAILLFFFLEKREAKQIHKKFIFLGTKNNPTEFIYGKNNVSVYHEKKYLRDEVRKYNSELYLDTLYINEIPVISISCFEKSLNHIIRQVNYNYEYKLKEIFEILDEAVKESKKKNLTTSTIYKSVFNANK